MVNLLKAGNSNDNRFKKRRYLSRPTFMGDGREIVRVDRRIGENLLEFHGMIV